jgi:O-antigen/teichoic acid export membrane protein
MSDVVDRINANSPRGRKTHILGREFAMRPAINRLINISALTLNQNSIRNLPTVLLDQAVYSGSNFLTAMIIARASTREELGLYMLGFTVVMFMTNIQVSLISSPYTVYFPRIQDREEALGYTGSTIIYQVGLSALAAVCLLVFSTYLSLNHTYRDLSAIIWIIAATIGFILLREYTRQIFLSRLETKNVMCLDIGVAVVQVASLLVLAWLNRISANSAYCVVGMACGVAGLIGLMLMRQSLKVRCSELIPNLRRNWGISKWVFPTSLVYTASMQVYPWMLTFYHGTSATGVLAACLGVIFLTNPFLLGMGNFLGPRASHAFSQGGVKDLRRLVLVGTVIIVAVMGVFSAAIFIGGDQVVRLIYGREYGGHAWLVWILSAGQLVSALSVPYNHGLLAMERPDVGFKSYLFALAITLTGGMWLVKSYGALGVALGLFSGNLVASAFRWLVFNRQIKLVVFVGTLR